MKHYLNLNKITPDWVRKNYENLTSPSFLHGGEKNLVGERSPRESFYWDCVLGGILQEKNDPYIGTNEKAKEIISILWSTAGYMKLGGISNIATANDPENFICKLSITQRGGYSDGNFKKITHIQKFYRIVK